MIYVDRFIATLMQVVIEHAGAETGTLILLEDDQLIVVAQCSGSRQCDLEKIAVADCATIPISVIHSVERSQATLVFDDAVREPSFLTDPYIQHQQTRSLLCMPILKQRQLIGILYLENNLSTGVFTRDRLPILNLLMAQAAISLENAQLYEQLADYTETLERTVEAQTQALQQEIAERQQTEAALRQSEAKFRKIFENSQVGIYRTRTCDGLILDANQRFADLFGFDSPEDVIGLKYTTDYYVNPSDRQQAIEMMKRDGEVRSFEVQMRKRDGTSFWGLFSSYLNADDDYIEGVIADISEQQAALCERKQAEAALQTSEERLRLALTASNQGLYDMNLKTEEIVVNPEYALMLGYDPATFHESKSRWVESLHPDDRESMVAIYRGFITGEAPNYRAEYRLRTRDGQWKWILSVGKIVAWNESGEPIRALGVYTDIDDLKRAEAASILEERNRMAREIHDTLAQAFTGILAQVGAANQVLTDDVEAAQAHLDLIKELARTGLTEARRSVVALRPQLLEEGSLQSALHRLVAQTRATAMDTTLYYETKGAVYLLPAEVESNLLRMGQEALTNAIRHANADEIRVELVYDRDQVCLRVNDNGQGFGVGSIPSSEGFGLLGMSERAERIGAQLMIRSQPGQGTEIIVTINQE
ncbi:MAG: PAS domain S-box protein [Leptolyngbya sp. DLM2.Bin15]|nr:MAG: PAS domain S-box protein [Leptolyngbya sp. DLM2.Bin15]